MLRNLYSSAMSVVGLCNPLLDISATVPHSILDKYDLKPGNAILAEEKHLPLYEELKKNYEVQYIAGGSGQNTIRATQWMLQKPNSTAFIGCIGKDENGALLKEKASADGVAIHYLEDPSTPTGTCAALVVDKERSLVANLAAANCYKKDHFDTKEIQEVVNAAQIIYISGFFLTVSPDTIVEAAEIASKTGKSFAMNVSAPFLVDFFWDKFEAVFDKIDYLFGNEHEFAALGKKLGFGEDLDQIVVKVAHFKKAEGKSRVVVCTQGNRATSIFDGKDIKTVPVPPVAKEEIVDVNGAGDSFVGGFLAGLLLGKDLVKCAEAGHYCAGETIRVSGTVFENRQPKFSW